MKKSAALEHEFLVISGRGRSIERYYRVERFIAGYMEEYNYTRANDMLPPIAYVLGSKVPICAPGLVHRALKLSGFFSDDELIDLKD